jgi:glycosyltransferase involved in cell wall biosynthesis
MAVRGLQAADGFFFASSAQADAWRKAEAIAPWQRTFAVMEASATVQPVPRSDARRRTRLEGDPAVLWVGRLNANKDPLTVLDGFDRSLASLPGARLTMIFGAGELLPEVLERLAASSRLRGRVRIEGPIAHEAIAAYFSAADIFAVGSHHEGSGYALLEACACGAVPVVTDIPSFRVITDGGRFGALWPAGDASAFARALVAVATGDLEAARTRMARYFDTALSWKAIGRQAVGAYRELTAARRQGAGISR